MNHKVAIIPASNINELKNRNIIDDCNRYYSFSQIHVITFTPDGSRAIIVYS